MLRSTKVSCSLVGLAAAQILTCVASASVADLPCSSTEECLKRASGRISKISQLHNRLVEQNQRGSGAAFASVPSLSVSSKSPSLGTKPGRLNVLQSGRPAVSLRGGAREASGAAATKMHDFEYDYFVIGGGSGGVRSSRIAAGYGAKVALAESASGGDTADGGFGGLGGTCVNVGCVPKKLMVYGSHYTHDIHDAKNYGWDIDEPTLNWGRFMEAKNKEIARLNGIYERMLGNSGVELMKGRATLVDPHTVEINGKQITADKILVAVGGWPMKPDIPGGDLAITSNEAFFLPERPERVIVVGGGYIAVEFAAIFHGYGAKVTQLYRGDLWLRGFDEDVRTHLATEYETAGIDVKFNSNIAKIEKMDSGLKATLEDGSVMEADVIMFATGRVPRTKNLGLEQAGVKTNEKGAIVVGDDYKTSVDSIYAVGDVIDRIQLTPVALAEGHCLADTLFGGKPRVADYRDVPTAVFSQPPIGTVGLTEEQARKEYGEVDIYRTSFRAMKHTISGRQEKTLMKLIVHPTTDKVLGVHMCGADSGEIIQLAGVAVKAGATKADFDSTIGVHPTSAEEFVTMRTKVEQPAPAAAGK